MEAGHVKVASDAGYEKIHKKKAQRAKIIHFPREEKGLSVERYTRNEM